MVLGIQKSSTWPAKTVRVCPALSPSDDRFNYPLLPKYCSAKARPKINKGTRNSKIFIADPEDWFCWEG